MRSRSPGCRVYQVAYTHSSLNCRTHNAQPSLEARISRDAAVGGDRGRIDSPTDIAADSLRNLVGRKENFPPSIAGRGGRHLAIKLNHNFVRLPTSLSCWLALVMPSIFLFCFGGERPPRTRNYPLEVTRSLLSSLCAVRLCASAMRARSSPY